MSTYTAFALNSTHGHLWFFSHLDATIPYLHDSAQGEATVRDAPMAGGQLLVSTARARKRRGGRGGEEWERERGGTAGTTSPGVETTGIPSFVAGLLSRPFEALEDAVCLHPKGHPPFGKRERIDEIPWQHRGR